MGFFEAWGKSVKEGQTKGAEARRKAEGVFAKARDAVAAAIAEIEAQPLQFQSAGARDKLVELHVASRKLHRLMGGEGPEAFDDDDDDDDEHSPRSKPAPEIGVPPSQRI